MIQTISIPNSLKREGRDTSKSYAVLAVIRPGRHDYSFLCADSATGPRVVIFDTPAIARDFVPILGKGRITHWLSDGETAHWEPALIGEINDIAIITNYDPYSQPANSPIPSESSLCDWKYHVMWNIWYNNAFSVTAEDGTVYNEALGDPREFKEN